MARVTSIAGHRQQRSGTATPSVRVTNPDRHGFVEFQFSLGDPTLYLEMTLPQVAFQQFCRAHGARRLSAAEGEAVDQAEDKWRFGDEHED